MRQKVANVSYDCEHYYNIMHNVMIVGHCHCTLVPGISAIIVYLSPDFMSVQYSISRF